MTDPRTVLDVDLAVRRLHTPRSKSGDGFTVVWCVECGQDWPCATEAAVADASGRKVRGRDGLLDEERDHYPF